MEEGKNDKAGAKEDEKGKVKKKMQKNKLRKKKVNMMNKKKKAITR